MKFWTVDKVKIEAKKYSHRTKFRKGSKGAYEYARRNNILEEVCEHMEILKKVWSKEEIKQEALKYLSRGKFYTYSQNAYAAANRMNILDEVCGHMKSVNSWDKESLRICALKYSTKWEFSKNSGGAYKTALKLGILEDICGHMKNVYRYWDENSIFKEALKYETRGDFSKESPSAYGAAIRKNILDSACKHMRVVGDKYKRCVYSIVSGNKIYIGITFDFEKRFHTRSHLAKMRREGVYTKIIDYIDSEYAVKLERWFINYYKNNPKWNCVNRYRGGSLGFCNKS